MVKYCVVKGCPNLQKKNDELSKSMFRFPVSNPELLDKWLESLSERDPKLKWSEQSKICEDHFEVIFLFAPVSIDSPFSFSGNRKVSLIF
jgi:hypothetical protein